MQRPADRSVTRAHHAASCVPRGRREKGAASMRSSRLIRSILVALALVVSSGLAHAAGNDTLVWDIAAGPQYVDPVMGTSAQANVMVLQNVYERLVWDDGKNTSPIPWRATGWESKDGGRRYVFKLRKGVKFHDGTELDANAVKFSIDRAVLVDDPGGIGSFFPTGSAAPGILKGAGGFSKSFGAGKEYWPAAVD